MLNKLYIYNIFTQSQIVDINNYNNIFTQLEIVDINYKTFNYTKVVICIYCN